MFGERTYTPGGDAINFASSIRIGMSYMKKSKQKGDDGQSKWKVVRIRTPKNKLAPPLNEIDLKMFRTGSIEQLKTKEKDDEPETLK